MLVGKSVFESLNLLKDLSNFQMNVEDGIYFLNVIN